MSIRPLARLAGAFYLAASVLFIMAAQLRARLVEGDAAASSEYLRSAASLLRIGIASDVASTALFVCTAIVLYALLRHVSDALALAMVVFVGLGAAIGAFEAMTEYAALVIAGREGAAVGQVTVDPPVAALLALQRAALVISDLTSGLWLLPLGYLVLRSGYFPRAIGALLLIGGVCWLARLLVHLLAPELTGVAAALVAGTVGELVFIVWLLVKGAAAP
jgi:hypothetical protein